MWKENVNVILVGAVKTAGNEPVSKIATCMGRAIMESVNATNIGKGLTVRERLVVFLYFCGCFVDLIFCASNFVVFLFYLFYSL